MTPSDSLKGRVLRALQMSVYICGNGHRFAIDIDTEPGHYMVRCPVCGDETRIEEDRG